VCVVLLRLNKLEEAARYFEKTLQLKADCEDARENLGLILRIRTILNKKRARCLKKATEIDVEYVAQLALGEDKTAHATNMHSKPRKARARKTV